MSDRPRYALHGGFVRSASDGDPHYIGVLDLARLYGLRPGEYVRWDDQDPSTYLGRNPRSYEHLYPRSDGRYELAAARVGLTRAQESLREATEGLREATEGLREAT